MQFQRYAIYYTPPAGKLAEFGASWLGWDITTGAPVPHMLVPDLEPPLDQLTITPRKYGFHGTIKPPFRLVEGASASELISATRSLCSTLDPVRLGTLKLTKLGSFFALVPTGETAALSDLAAKVVQGLDGFRAPASAEELEKRRKARLSERQEANLVNWGYPYVLDDFRFHLTLTGQVKPDVAAQVEAVLASLITQIPPSPLEITDLTLVGEDADGRFHEIERFALG